MRVSKKFRNEYKFAKLDRAHIKKSLIPQDWEEFVGRSQIRSGNEFKQFIPYDYQRELVKIVDNHPVTIVVKSRQLGITQAIVSKFLHNAALNPAYTGMSFCRNQDDASAIARRAREMLFSLKDYLSNESDSLGYMKISGGGQLHFKNGAKEGGRGYDSVSGFLFDEAAFADNIESIYASASASSAMVGRDASKVIVSTPSAQSGWFWDRLNENNDEQDITEICEEISSQVKPPFYYFVDSQNTAKVFIHWRSHPIFSGYDDYLGFRQEQDGTSWEVIRREYDLVFENTDVAVFSPQLIRECICSELPTPQLQARYFIGIDTATTGADFVCAIVLMLWDDRYYIVDTYRQSTGTAEYHQFKISELIDKYKPTVVGVEVTGGTGQIYLEQLSATHRSTSFESIRTTGDSKPAMIDRVKLALEKGLLGYANNHPVIGEMLNFRRSGAKLEAATGKHDDTVMALAFALAISPLRPSNRNPFSGLQVKSNV